MANLLKYADFNSSTISQNGKHQFAQNHALIHYQSKSIYSFIPKNACSTMRLSLAKANGCIHEVAQHAWIHENNATFRATLEQLVTTPYSFVILRCPYSRLLSVYLDTIVERKNDAWALVNRRLERTILISELSFERFVKLMRVPLNRHFNIHWRPQIDFLVFEKYDDYFNFHHFNKVEKQIKEKLDIDLLDARSFTLHGTERFEKIETEQPAYQLAPHQLLMMKLENKIPYHHTFYNQDLIDIVKQCYAEDIALFKQHFGAEDLMFKE